MVPSVAQMVDVLVEDPVTVNAVHGAPTVNVTELDAPTQPVEEVAVTV